MNKVCFFREERNNSADFFIMPAGLFSRWLIAITLSVLACFVSPSQAGNTALVVSGGPDEPITRGASFVYLPANGTFTWFEQGNGIRFVFHGGSIPEQWEVDLSAAYGSSLEVGSYNNTNGAGVFISGFLTSCGQASGSFVVHELVRELDGVIVSFHASFRQVCGDTDATALTGEIFYNSSDPLPPPTRITNSNFTAFLTKGQPFRFQLTSSAHLPGYSATGLPPGLTVNFSTGLISGTPTAEGVFSAAITVLDATNNTSGSATLQLTVDSASHSRGPYSAISLIGDPGNYVTRSRDLFVGPSEAVVHGGTNAPLYSGASVAGGGWGVSIATGDDTPLVPGMYPRHNPPAPGDPRVSVSGPNGGNAFGSTGSFEVLTFGHDDNGQLKDFRANFEYHYINEVPAVRGTIWYGVTNAITSRGQESFAAGTPFFYQIISNIAPTSFAAENLPPGLTVNAETGIISGIPTMTGRYMVSVSAFNGDKVAKDTISFYVFPAAPAPPAPPPVMALSVNTAQVHEGGVARFTVTSSAPSAFNLTPRVQITRKKASPTDYTLTPFSFTIPAGQTTASMDLHAAVDSVTEKPESVTIKLTKGPGYKVGPSSKATVTILDGP
jgi:putative Ig domain-containing protein